MRRWMAGLAALVMVLLTMGQALAEEDFSLAFSNRFLAEGEAPIITETSYQSHDIYVEITTQRFEKSDVYVADIYIRSLNNFQRRYADGDWHKATSTVPIMAEASGGILVMTGDSSQNFQSGWVIGNGVVERDAEEKQNRQRDLCIIYRDGTMRTLQKPTIDNHAEIAQSKDDIWHIFLFGPALLDEEGHAFRTFDKNFDRVRNSNPRSALGYYEPGHYCFVQVDGRQTKSALEEGARNQGLSLKLLAQLMESLGCKAAYNLDGGRSSMLWFNGGLVSTPAAADRKIGDIMVIMEVE